jgi:uncharacterized membrane-anchored protein YhcB (DUF1043 family)
MDLVSLLILLIVGIAIGAVSILLYSQYRHLRVVRDLCDLRANALDLHRDELKVKTAIQLTLSQELTDTVQQLQKFYHRYQRLRDAPAKEQAILYTELRKAQAINDDLSTEMSKLFAHNMALEAQVDGLKQQERRLGEVLTANFDLRAKLQKLEARNVELEYAINLESISMIEGYDARDKLYSAIDDVRRSLTRILNTA